METFKIEIYSIDSRYDKSFKTEVKLSDRDYLKLIESILDFADTKKELREVTQ